MKKYITFLLFIFLSFCVIPALAQDIDLTALSWEELSDFKQKVEYEYYSRPEAEVVTLSIGEYKVGVDLHPGKYFLYKGTPGGSEYTYINIYDKDGKSVGYSIYPDFKVPSVTVEEGYTIRITNGSVSFSLKDIPVEEFYSLAKPEGTLVPAGTYFVGKDIPAGSYRLYPLSISGAEAGLYMDQDSYAEQNDNYIMFTIDYETDNYGQLVYLPEGAVFVVKPSIVMKKTEALNFD